MSNWQTMHSFRTDRGVVEHKLAPGIFRRVLTFARPYRSALIAFLFLVVIDAALGIVLPLLFRELIDVAIPRHRLGLVYTIAAITAGISLFEAGLTVANRWYSARIGEGIIYDLRTKVFDHIQRMPLAFFTRTQTGALVSRLNSDVIGAQQAFTSTLSGVVTNVIGLTGTLIVMFALSWQITLLSLVLLPLFIYPVRRVGTRLQQITREGMNLNAAMNQTMTERFNVAGAHLVKLFGRPDDETSAFSAKADRVRAIGITSAMYSRVFFVALTTVASFATALVYGLGGYQAVRGTITAGTVVALASYLGRLYGPLTSLSNIRVDVMNALVSFERVFEILDLAPMIADKPTAISLRSAPTSITFDHVSFSYPSAQQVSLASLESVAVLEATLETPVLHDVSFTVEPGQMVALVGHSGAGKSTIGHLLTRTYDVTGGAVRLGGTDVREASLASIRDLVGVVTQDAHLFHDTIRANLLFARPQASETELWDALEGAQIAELVRSLADGLQTVVGERGYRLSGGEKARIAIARLLLKSPGIVLLDEATAHLDSESEAAVQAALNLALTGRTSLVIAHRLSTIRQAHAIVVLEAGRIVQHGTHEALLAEGGLYADLYRTQFATHP